MTHQRPTPLEQEAHDFLDSQLKQATAFVLGMVQKHGPTTDALAHCMEQFAQDAARLPVPDDVECHAGCGYCCHTRVSASIPEVLVVAHLLQSHLPTADLAAVIGRINLLTKQADTTSLAWWQQTATPCPFLSPEPEFKCSIYPIRPFTCRAHHSTSVAQCRTGFHNRTTLDIPSYPVLRTGTDLFSAAFIISMRRFGLPSYEVGFIPALALIFSDTSVAERWQQGEDVFALAAL